MSTLHCALENESNLYVNELKKIQQYRARSVEERRRRRRRKKKKNAKARSTEERRKKIFYFAWCVRKLRGVYVNCAIIVMLYTHSIVNQP